MKFFRIPNQLASITDTLSNATRTIGLALGLSILSSHLYAEKVIVTFTNEGPANGIYLVSPWIAFHDGSFDSFDSGAAASDEIEAIAEDGNTGPLDATFKAGNPNAASATIGGPTGPGISQTYQFDLDPNDPNNRYMSYVVMLIPSNDAFAGNAEPTTYEIFDESGNFVARPITIPGSAVYDAGTEVNDEVPENVAFLAQAAPNTGLDENSTVALHPGFMAIGTGGILDASREFGGSTINFSEGNFTQPDYTLARINVSMLNNPDTSSNLINISTRSLVGSGENTQIAGFVIEGESDKQVLIRAIGPSLTQFDLTGILADPTISVFNGQEALIASNDDIGNQEGGQSAVDSIIVASNSTGAFSIAPDSLDSALLLTLAPGSYTVQVLPKNGETGVALVEVYQLQD